MKSNVLIIDYIDKLPQPLNYDCAKAISWANKIREASKEMSSKGIVIKTYKWRDRHASRSISC